MEPAEKETILDLPQTNGSEKEVKQSQPQLNNSSGLPPSQKASAQNLSTLKSKPHASDPIIPNTINEQPKQPQQNAHKPIEIPEDMIKDIQPIFLTGITKDILKIKQPPQREGSEAKLMYFVVKKSDLMLDLSTRLAISDLYPVKPQIMEFPGDEMLLCVDSEYKYGQNFYLCCTQRLIDHILNPPAEIVKSSENLGPKVYKWVNLGSDKEIDEEKVVNSRNLISVKLTRKRKDFYSSCKFGDRDAHDGFLECRPFRDPNFEVTKMEIDASVQAVPELVDCYAQTTWFRPMNCALQYEPITLSNEDCEIICQLDEVADFMKTVTIRFEKALQQNSIMDIFSDDFKNFGDDDINLEPGSHTYLQEYQSFKDLVHSRDRSISCVDWHPSLKGVLAISCSHQMTLDERIENGFTIKSKESLILIWNFHDPIHPQLLLEAPEDISTFKFNPHDHNIIIGGCQNGQIVVWDISEHQDKLKSTIKKQKLTNDQRDGDASGAVGGNKQSESLEVIVKWCAVSSIEYSHKSAVQEVYWLPKNLELLPSGEAIENAENGHKQIVSTSLDGQVLFWDIRAKKDLRSLDLVWKPFSRVPLSSMDNTFDYGLTKISIQTPNGKKEEKEKERPTSGTQQKNATATEKRHFTSKFFCSTEEGDLTYNDWISEKTSEEKASSRVEVALPYHYGPMSDLQRNPFFEDILLSVGGWNFYIWKEKITIGPLLSSAQSTTYYICGRWSPTRAGVFYLSKADGTIEVWDLMDQSHAACCIQNISSIAISSMEVRNYLFHGKTNGGSNQFIAAGDDDGTLHILEVPKNLVKSVKNEKSIVRAFFDREVKRINYVSSRKQQRVRDKLKYEAAIFEALAAKTKEGGSKEDNGASGEPAQIAASAEPVGSTPQQENLQNVTDKEEEEYRKLEKEVRLMTGLAIEETTEHVI
ncbi:WD repeat-containing protein 63 [Nowakowskiella sp. JEL0407]|nr:WD repeat-containing protein 63 [Nowakowskiella sp. JEL0407]